MNSTQLSTLMFKLCAEACQYARTRAEVTLEKLNAGPIYH